jgi:hypothetical protein
MKRLRKVVSNKVVNIIAEELDKREVLKLVKNDKDFEKSVRKIVTDVIVDMYRVLWQHNSIFKTLGK